MSTQFEFIQLFQFGGPVAELMIEGEIYLFDPDGIQSLIEGESLNDDAIATLEDVRLALSRHQYAYHELPEVSAESLSGQMRIGV